MSITTQKRKGGKNMARRKLRFRLRQKEGEKGIFLPESVLKSLTNATESELKFLIILAREGRDKDYLSESELLPACEKAGIDRETFTEVMGFFRGAGLVENEDESSKPIVEKVTPATPEPTPKPHKPSYTSEELASAADDRKFAELLDFAQKSLGKTFNRNDIATVYSFVESLLLPHDVIMLAIEHCVTEGKPNLRYIEKLLIDFADREVNTYERAEEYILARASYKSFEGKIRKMLGLGQRTLTSREKSIITAWQTEWSCSDELIEFAYEKTVEKTGKASMSYMNKILENWHNAGFKTRAEVETGDVKPTSSTSEFDPDEFFSIAIAHAKNKKKEQE